MLYNTTYTIYNYYTCTCLIINYILEYRVGSNPV